VTQVFPPLAVAPAQQTLGDRQVPAPPQGSAPVPATPLLAPALVAFELPVLAPFAVVEAPRGEAHAPAATQPSTYVPALRRGQHTCPAAHVSPPHPGVPSPLAAVVDALPLEVPPLLVEAGLCDAGSVAGEPFPQAMSAAAVIQAIEVLR
jgi:hypothetical protein